MSKEIQAETSRELDTSTRHAREQAEETLELLPTRRSLLRHRAEEQETRKDCGE